MSPKISAYALPELLVDTAWLQSHLADAGVRVMDMGMWDGYLRAHIPGAVHPGPERSHWLKDPGDPLHVMPAGMFQALMEGRGVGDGTSVVAYDDDGGHQAARLWAVMRAYGNDRCRILNGGWNKWLAESRPVAQVMPQFERTAFTVRPRKGVFAQLDEVKAFVGNPAIQILDVRSQGEWEGTETRGNHRPGRIPGAFHIEWKDAVTGDAIKAFRPPEDIRERLRVAGVTLDRPVVTYCQAGVRASHAAFVLRLLGCKDVRVYDGSFAEWGNRDDTPIER